MMSVMCTMLVVYVLTMPEPSGYLIDPCITAYGLIATDDHCSQLYLLRNDSLILLMSSPGCGRYYTVSNDQTQIGCKEIYRDGLQAPVLVNVKTGKRTRLHAPVPRAGQVSFSNNGLIVYTIDRTLYVKNHPLQSYDLGAYVNYTQVSPDGKLVVFSDTSDRIWILSLETSMRTCITHIPEYGYCLPQWSPDSRFILYSRLDSGIEVFDTETRTTRFISKGYHPQWSTDSRGIVFHVMEIEDCELTGSDLYIAQYDGSSVQRLTYTPFRHEMDPSYYGDNQIVFRTYDTCELWTAEIRNGQLLQEKVFYTLSRPLKTEYYEISQPARDSINVPYLNQVYDTPDWFNGHWACAPTTAMMAIAYYRKLPYWNCWCSLPYGHTCHFGRYICELYHYREVDYNLQAQDPGGNWAMGGYGYMWSGTNRPYTHMAPYLLYHDINSWRDDSPTFNEVISELDAGYPYGMCVGLTAAGHLVLAVGQVLNWHTLIFNDPYGNKNTPGYPSYDGKYARYDWPGYNNGYENLNNVYWCVGIQGDWEPPADSVVDDLCFQDGFHLFNDPPASMVYWRDALSGFNNHMWWTYTTDASNYDTCFASWRFWTGPSGDYEVFVYIPSVHANATAARYQVFHDNGHDIVIIDQSNYSDEWVSLGIYSFSLSSQHVYLGDATGIQGQHIGYDAMRWSYQGSGITWSEQEFAPCCVIVVGNPITQYLNMICKCDQPYHITVKIFSVTGQCMLERNLGTLSKGTHPVYIDVSNFASGVYIVKTRWGSQSTTSKVVMIKEQ